MSERKSWDIQPNKKKSVTPEPQKPMASAARPTRRAVEPMVRRAALQKQAARPASKRSDTPRPRQEPEPIKTTVVRRERIPQGKNREPLKDRRKRSRRILRTALILFFILLIGATIASLWLPQVRIQSVTASGPESDGIRSVAQTSLQGAYYFVIPRDSIFFFSQQTIRHNILTQQPNIAAVSIYRTSFQSIAISSIARESAFLWCGATPDSAGTVLVDLNATTTAPTVPSCYNADSQGYVFSPSNQVTADSFRIYDALNVPDKSPLGARLQGASSLPNALQFVKVIKSLGVSVVSLALRSDEADMYTQGGTKITYVIGQEDAAAKLAESAFPTLNLNDGSLEYVDLRFTDKVYFKKKGETATGTSTPAQ